jgi:hypothetical protein
MSRSGRCVIWILFAVAAPAALAQAPPAAPSQAPVAVPAVYEAPEFVPADVLLRQADQIQPLTAEGWIVTTRPVVDCAAAPAFRGYDELMRFREYQTQLRLVRAEIAILDERLAVYHYFNKAGALMVDFQNTLLARIAAGERLRNLRYEHMLYTREQLRHPREVVTSRTFVDGK